MIQKNKRLSQSEDCSLTTVTAKIQYEREFLTLQMHWTQMSSLVLPMALQGHGSQCGYPV